MLLLRKLFIGTLVLTIGFVGLRAPWNATATLGQKTWIYYVPYTSPIWLHPKPPKYDEFKKAFESLPPEGTPGFSIESALNMPALLSRLMLCLWGTSACFGLYYYMASERKHDQAMHVVSRVGLTLSIATLFSLFFVNMMGVFGPIATMYGIAWGLLSFEALPRKRVSRSLEEP